MPCGRKIDCRGWDNRCRAGSCRYRMPQPLLHRLIYEPHARVASTVSIEVVSPTPQPSTALRLIQYRYATWPLPLSDSSPSLKWGLLGTVYRSCPCSSTAQPTALDLGNVCGRPGGKIDRLVSFRLVTFTRCKGFIKLLDRRTSWVRLPGPDLQREHVRLAPTCGNRRLRTALVSRSTGRYPQGCHPCADRAG